ncbi:MAG: MFS transporter [Gammaproteobacteria bacterium]|nr:MFS transporter [Gammaproteobacteria bacterium]
MLQRAMIRRNLLLLATCQGLMLSCTSLIMTTSALVGVVLAPSPTLATLPLGLLYLSIMLTMIPASLFMKHFGRRVGFALGGVVGAIGGSTAAYGIYQDSFTLFCIGSAIFGIANGFGQYYRFAAVEIVDVSYKSRAISWVMVGGLVAAFIGPNVARVTRDIVPGAVFSASYAAVALFCVGIIVVQLFVRIPKPSAEEVQGEKRELGFILTRPTFLVAVLCAMIAYGTMNLLMTATPLAMNHRGMNFGSTAVVIQWHIVGMFAPAFFTGNLIHRFGVLKIMFAGALMLIACGMVALSGQLYWHFFVGLMLLGIGWNFLYIGGTTLLTEVYLPAEKGEVQGINEFLVFSATALTALSSGYLHHTLGWERLNQYTMPVVGFTAVIILLLGWQVRQQKARQALA